MSCRSESECLCIYQKHLTKDTQALPAFSSDAQPHPFDPTQSTRGPTHLVKGLGLLVRLLPLLRAHGGRSKRPSPGQLQVSGAGADGAGRRSDGRPRGRPQQAAMEGAQHALLESVVEWVLGVG